MEGCLYENYGNENGYQLTMEEWKNKVIYANEVARLYAALPYEWLLLHVLKNGLNGKAEEFALISHSKVKDDLYDIIMEEESDKKNMIFVFADPDGICEI